MMFYNTGIVFDDFYTFRNNFNITYKPLLCQKYIVVDGSSFVVAVLGSVIDC